MMRLPLILALLSLLPAFAAAEVRDVDGTAGALFAAMEQLQAGDTLRLKAGTTYDGPLVIAVEGVTLEGNGAEIDGHGQGSVLTLDAPGIVVRNLTVFGSGSGGEGLDAGITLTKRASRAVVENTRVLGNLVGIDIHGARDALVRNNRIEGRREGRMNDRGNGIYVWNAPGARVIGNDVRWGRDGVFVNTSKNNAFIGNRFRDLRFAVHYMYANNSVVAGNISIGNHLGYAIMYSDRVRIENNLSRGDRDHGVMMNYTNSTLVRGNTVEGLDGGPGPEKCVFIYNAHRNTFTGNRFAGCNIGIHFTAGSEKNAIYNNAFVANRTQVKYVGSRWVEWSFEGTGNYWSDHAAFDLDNNGVADSAYRPNDIMDQVLWSQPAAKALLGSPAVQLIRWSQSAFPATLPGGVIDRVPLMQPPAVTIPQWPYGGEGTRTGEGEN